MEEINDYLYLPEFINKLKDDLRLYKLIDPTDNLAAVLKVNTPLDKYKVNWLGSQKTLMFMFSLLVSGNRINNESLYHFVSTRFLVKGKPVTSVQLNNCYNSILSLKEPLPEPLNRIIEIISKTLRYNKNVSQ